MSYLLEKVTALGGDAALDDYGNLIATFEASGARTWNPILLSCHGDTVKPGVGIEPVLTDGVIRSKGDTILGADDKAGIAEVLEALQVAPIRPPIEFAVSRQEEVGLLGCQGTGFRSTHGAPRFSDGQRHPRHHHHRRADLLRHRCGGARHGRSRRHGARKGHQCDPGRVQGHLGPAPRPNRPRNHRQRGCHFRWHHPQRRSRPRAHSLPSAGRPITRRRLSSPTR